MKNIMNFKSYQNLSESFSTFSAFDDFGFFTWATIELELRGGADYDEDWEIYFTMCIPFPSDSKAQEFIDKLNNFGYHDEIEYMVQDYIPDELIGFDVLDYKLSNTKNDKADIIFKTFNEFFEKNYN